MARALQPSPVPGVRTSDGIPGDSAMVSFGGKSISQRREPEDEQQSQPTVDPAFLTTLANYLETAWERNKRAKLRVERRMLRALRRRNRTYEADVWAAIQSQGGSEHYDGLTPTKCRAAESWILDVLVPTGDRPWDIEHTPIPELSPEVTQELQQKANQAAVRDAVTTTQMTGEQPDTVMMTKVAEMVSDLMEEVYAEELEKEAQSRARKMADKIDDQLKEGNFHSEFVDAVRDFVTFPAAFMMGPVFHRKRSLKYVQAPNGEWMPKVGFQVTQSYERVSPFDVYPEDDSTGTQDGDLFVRMRISAKQMAGFKGTPGYDSEAIDAVLEEYGRGGFRRWTTIDAERSHAENRSNHEYESNKIDVLRFWGSVKGSWLLDHAFQRGTGVNTQAIEPNEYYEVDCMKVGQYVVRAIVNPDKLGRRPISKASYEEVPGAFWGNGVPDLIEHDQDAANAMARSIVNNTALSAGPIYERNVDRTPADDGRLYPLKQFLATEDQMASGAPAVRFYSVPNNTNQMMEVWGMFHNQADENSGVPAYAHGSEDVGGAGNTASGLSMLMSSSSKLLRMAIYNMDIGVVEPVIERTYHHNMLFSKDESIKGDLKVVPKGATVLLIREQMAARQGEFADSTNNPIDYALMTPEGRLELRRNQARNLNLDVDGIYPKEFDELQAPPAGGQPPGGQGGGGQDPEILTGGAQPETLDRTGRPQADFQRQ